MMRSTLCCIYHLYYTKAKVCRKNYKDLNTVNTFFSKKTKGDRTLILTKVTANVRIIVLCPLWDDFVLSPATLFEEKQHSRCHIPMGYATNHSYF